METRAERVKRSRKDKRKRLLIYIHLYSLSLLISGLIINSTANPKGSFSKSEMLFCAVLCIPCAISYVVATNFFEEKLGQFRMLLPIVLGALAGTIIWMVL